MPYTKEEGDRNMALFLGGCMKKKWYRLEGEYDEFITCARTKKGAIKEFEKHEGYNPDYIQRLDKIPFEYLTWNELPIYPKERV